MKLPEYIAAYKDLTGVVDIRLVNNKTNKSMVANLCWTNDCLESVVKNLIGGCGWDVKQDQLGDEVLFGAPAINHKELLKKYIAHSISSTDIEQGDVLDLHLSNVDFTDEEIKELERLS